ncbi:MAG: Nramp family divalent metal transporter [Lentisphaeria bacterium]|nr:Nramp family divalent metal transporter [Lentisphaeria bacterium]
MDQKRKKLSIFLLTIGPGLLVAATGVGAGDLASGALAGSNVGLAILWSVPLGAFLKYVLNEGLTRWQLATGQTLLEGAILRLGKPVQYLFIVYLLIWSYYVGVALMGACGVTLHAMIPIFDKASTAKVVFGIAASLAGCGLVMLGGFKLFERIMNVTIVVMFVIVITTALLICKDWGGVFQGLLTPQIPAGGLGWTLALMGGVGGTLTVLCYGYWIREKGRTDKSDLKTCRLDLAVAYIATALFGIAMVIIGSEIQVEGKGAGLIVTLADALEKPLGPAGRWLFLIGAFGALFSSLLGVWQAVPYIFADFCRLTKELKTPTDSGPKKMTIIDEKGSAYRGYLFAITLVPMVGLMYSFTQMQLIYAVFGAFFMPLLAAVLLIMNNRESWVGADMKNRWFSNSVLVLTLVFFIGVGGRKLLKKISPKKETTQTQNKVSGEKK